jgi:hypothetical protein
MESPQKWGTVLTALDLEMQRLKTDLVLAKMISSRLHTWQMSKEPSAFDNIQEKYKEVLQNQDTQVWQNFWMGLLSKGWQEIQKAHYQQIVAQKTGSSWLIAIIWKRWLVACDIWDYV